jgi:hypothetical protein
VSSKSSQVAAVEDQRENDRREREARRIATLPTDEQQTAIDAEEARQASYNDNGNHSVLPTNNTPINLPGVVRSRSNSPSIPIPSINAILGLDRDVVPRTNSSPSISQSAELGRSPRHMTLDGTLAGAIILPPPNGSGLPPFGASVHGAGVFRCDYLGCSAPPFQTQYLLKYEPNTHFESLGLAADK